MLICKLVGLKHLIVDPAALFQHRSEDTPLALGQIDAVFVGLAHKFIITRGDRNSKSVRMFTAVVGSAQPERACPPRAAAPFIRRIKSAVFWLNFDKKPCPTGSYGSTMNSCRPVMNADPR